LWLLGLLLAVPALAAPGEPEPFALGSGASSVRLSTEWNRTQAVPGQEVILAVVARMGEGFHINADLAQERSAGDFDPYETDLRLVDASPALSARSIRYPRAVPLTAEYFEGEILGFGGTAVFYVPFLVEADAAGGPLSVTIEFEYQACNEVICEIPRIDTLTAVIPIGAAGADPAPTLSATFAGFEEAVVAGGSAAGTVGFDLFGWSFSIDAGSGAGLLLLVLIAMVGGALLNFTPCVLPMIPIKIMGLCKAAGGPRRMFALGAVMALGVVAFWLGLGVLISMVSGFTATNQLFQYPAFTITVGVIIAVMAIGMCGLFAVRLPQWIYMINPKHDSLGGSFGFGVMTAVLSTPCTAPFMGAAAAWAATQHWTTTLSTFAAIGAGMALPYLILSAFPALVDRMPRTGPASELIKQVMGLLMLAAAAFFIGSGLSGLLKEPTDPANKMYWWVVMGLVVAAGGWLIWRTIRITPSAVRRGVFAAVGLLLIAAGSTSALALTAKGPIAWEYYNPQRFEQRVAEGKIIIMDFTAEWCANCKTLEHTVLYTDRIVELTKQPDIVAMQVDLTGNNPVGNAKLLATGRRTIPLLAIFGPDGELRWMSDFYTVQNIVDAVAEVRGKAVVEPVSAPPRRGAGS
jgi:thiol:disulfide interchange protein DsbD